jgi:tRNA-splicing ligase RtcB
MLGIIPGSMGAKSFIVKGKGNKESFMSCSHGAGRVMSRTEARATITLGQHAKDTEGVECRKDSDVLDESPKAYKDIDAVMKAQEDLVEIVHTLKQVSNGILGGCCQGYNYWRSNRANHIRNFLGHLIVRLERISNR